MQLFQQSTQYAMKVESFDWDENANAMVRDTLYISQKAAPVYLSVISVS